ncbi:MAG: hypothetical protein ABFE01_19910 [Phycisphaerales bacterium]
MIGQAAFVLCTLLIGSADAREAAEPLQWESPQAWRIAPEVSHYRYREPGVMTNEGTLYGVVGSYAFFRRGASCLSPEDGNDVSWSTLALDGRISAGEVDYDGSFMDGTPLSTSGTDDLLIDIRLLWSRHWQPTRFLQAFYAGLGYRYLNDDSTGQVGGYERQSNYLYIPLGVRKDFELASRWGLALRGEFDYLVVGRQISSLNDVDPDLPTVRNWQWPGFGVGLFADFLHKGRTANVGLGPFLRYWWVAESDTTDEGYYEPENNTLEYGLSFVVEF